MIRLFLKELPYTLTRPMYREFVSKQAKVARWREASKSERVKTYLDQNEIIEYLFALGIYYRYVIGPMTRAGAFFERIEDRDIPSLLIGGKEIGPKFRQSIYNAADHFYKVITKYGLSESFFTITDVKSIITALIRIDERRQDGEE